MKDSTDPRDHQPGAGGTEQNHNYTPSKSYQPPADEHSQAPDAGKGARGDRSRGASPATAGHHVKTMKAPKRDGGADPVRNEREAHFLGNRKESEAGVDNLRKPANAAWRKKVAAHKRVAGNR